jgi:hypothetical protein
MGADLTSLPYKRYHKERALQVSHPRSKKKKMKRF